MKESSVAEGARVPLPFQVEFREMSGELVVWQTYGSPPHHKTKRKVISSVEALVGAVYEHRYEAYLQSRLAQALLQAGITHLGADPASTTPVSEVLRQPQAAQSG
jgi:hypothetical protein